jgi:soluble lytic murein transglycosylase-like protein
MKLNRKWLPAGASHERIAALLTQGLAGFGLLMLVLLISGRSPSGLGIVEPASASINPAARLAPALDARQQKLAQHLARRYRVSPDVVQELVADAYAVGRDKGIDPLLILAVVAVESSFNPIAQSSFGAKGLMQVVPRFHLEKLSEHGGQENILHTRTNIAVGTQILKDYIREAGSVEVALQMYAGAMDDETSAYSQKVIAERDRLHQVLRGLTATNA